jgi:hypothetical protein
MPFHAISLTPVRRYGAPPTSKLMTRVRFPSPAPTLKSKTCPKGAECALKKRWGNVRGNKRPDFERPSQQHRDPPPKRRLRRTAQGGQQSKVARFGVHFRSRLERGSDQAAPPLARVDGLEPMKKPCPRGRPAGHLSEDRAARCPAWRSPAAEQTLVGQGRLAVSTIGKKSLH